MMSRYAALSKHWPWLPEGLGAFVLPVSALLCLLLPTYHDAASSLWKQEEHAYAPLLTALSFCLLFYRLRDIRPAPVAAPAAGMLLLSCGLVLYAVGRSQRVDLLELGALIPVMAGMIATLGGRAALRALRFPLLFLLFALPYPGWVIDSLTSPLKELIAAGAERVLYAAGYPVARSGVVLGLGPYRLLVADACSGLHSLIFLSALGLLYLHLTGNRTALHRSILVLALVPIALLANFFRVLILLLLTYYFGDAVGQSFWHDLTGLALFVSAFAVLIGMDGVLALLIRRPAVRSEKPCATETGLPKPGEKRVRSLAVSLALLAAVAGANMLTPTQPMAARRPVPDLNSGIPARLGDWTMENPALLPLVAPDVQAGVQRIYSQTVNRIYVNGRGERIMLAIAYGADQSDGALQVHRPEYCYKAQGFSLADPADGRIFTAAGELPVRRLVARLGSRIEPITYWMTVGNETALPGMRRKLAQLRYGLRGQIADGMLIRISSLGGDSGRAFRLHESFISELQQALPESLRAILAPSPASALSG